MVPFMDQCRISSKTTMPKEEQKQLVLKYRSLLTEFLQGRYHMESDLFYPETFQKHLFSLWGMPVEEMTYDLFYKALKRVFKEQVRLKRYGI